MMNDISPEELDLLLAQKEPVILLDVREDWEYEEVNIGGKLFPLNSIPFKLGELESYRDREIIVHCKSGTRSNQARKYLIKKGFTRVRALTGGIEAYLRLKN